MFDLALKIAFVLLVDILPVLQLLLDLLYLVRDTALSIRYLVVDIYIQQVVDKVSSLIRMDSW